MRKRHLLITALVFFALAVPVFAQQPFNKSEFVARREKLFEKIPDGIAVLFGAKAQHYPVKFRQAPDFYYLTGIEEPGAVLVLTGPNKRSILFAPRRSEAQIRADGPESAISVIQQMVPQLVLQDLTPLLDEMRWIKSPYEIELARKSAEIGAEGVKEAMKGTQPGMYEYELEAAARYVYTKRGARGDAFRPIVASGPNTVILIRQKALSIN